MRWLLSMVLLAGCATSTAGVDRHAAAFAPAPAHQPPWALDTVFLRWPRAGQLAASREWERSGADRVVYRSDDAVLRADFVRALGRAVPLDPAAPRRLRATLQLQDTGYFEGLAAETSDVTMTAEILDRDGNVVGSLTLREPASAPLQRSASREQRLAPAFDRLAKRLAEKLAALPPSVEAAATDAQP
jgi:hypothetical protein